MKKNIFLCSEDYKYIIMKHFFHEFLFYSKGQRIGIIALALLIIVVFMIDRAVSSYSAHNSLPTEEAQQQTAEEVRQFLTSLQQKKDSMHRKRYPSYAASGKQREAEVDVRLAPFNPNLADSLTFRQLGIPAWMTHNILRYRAKGGNFKKAADFKKIYGMNEELYLTLLPYIQLPESITPAAPKNSTTSLLVPAADSLQMRRVEKYALGTQIELNSADTTELKKIPGIGGNIARMIVNYRQKLGGFYDLKQLEEIRIDYQQLIPWFYINEQLIQRIPVNKASVERLNRHPYINFYQAKALIEYRRKKGSVKNLKPFALLDEFPKKDVERMVHYLDFTEYQ